MTADLTAFVLARIDEEQAAAENNDWLAFEYGVDSFGRQAFSTRVLAQCAALREVVALHRRDPLYGGSCSECSGADDEPARYPCPTLRALAGIWRDHDEWREEWL